MNDIEAVFTQGMFKPLGAVNLPDNARVRLHVQPLSSPELPDWLRSARELRNQLFEQYGYFPDSTADIAEDRAPMSDAVFDSCVAVKWYLPEPDSVQAEQAAAAVAARGGKIIVLDLALVEIANAIWKRQYRGLVTPDQARALLQKVSASTLAIEAANRLLVPALEIAMKYRCAVYDALFVALASDLKLTGITADEPLVRAVAADFPNIVLLRNWQP